MLTDQWEKGREVDLICQANVNRDVTAKSEAVATHSEKKRGKNNLEEGEEGTAMWWGLRRGWVGEKGHSGVGNTCGGGEKKG